MEPSNTYEMKLKMPSGVITINALTVLCFLYAEKVALCTANEDGLSMKNSVQCTIAPILG